MTKAKKPAVAQQRAAKLAELKDDVRRRLARFWSRRLEQLRRIASQPPPSGTTRVRFEIFDAYTTLSVWLYADGANGESESSDPFGSLMADLRFPQFDTIPWDAYRWPSAARRSR